ncbi:MAG: hypothetical protein Q9187_000477 [Circinaria calcarea]
MRLVNNVGFSKTDDVTFDLTPVGLWTATEIASGILCGCLPVLPQFFRHYMPKLKNVYTSLRPGKAQGTSNTEPSSLSRSGGEKGAKDPWATDHWDPSVVKGSYVELSEREQHRMCDDSIQGGSALAMVSTDVPKPRDYDLERDAFGNGIRKTVRVESPMI